MVYGETFLRNLKFYAKTLTKLHDLTVFIFLMDRDTKYLFYTFILYFHAEMASFRTWFRISGIVDLRKRRQINYSTCTLKQQLHSFNGGGAVVYLG